ncbi:MAG: response regulator [Acidobacteriota bacterium]
MSQPNLLVVSDDVDFSRQVSPTLRADGFRVVLATPADALAALATEYPELVVLDATGPNGLEAGRGLQERPAHFDVPMLWVVEPESEKDALFAGACALMTRPIEKDDLLGLVRAFVEDREACRDLQACLRLLQADIIEEAVFRLRRLADSGPVLALRSWARHHAGHARLRQGDSQAAAEEFFDLLAEDPVFWWAHVQLGLLFHDAGYDEESLEHFRHAVQLHPDLPEVRRRLMHAVHEIAEVLDEAPEPELAVQPLRPVAPVASEEQEEGERRTVLLADDSELARAMVTESLEKAGFRVLAAADGAEALALLDDHQPDLMILDGVMPGASGFEVCREVKGERMKEEPPAVLIFSALAAKAEERRRAADAGADGMVAKSTDDRGLIEAVQRLLSRPPRRLLS